MEDDILKRLGLLFLILLVLGGESQGMEQVISLGANYEVLQMTPDYDFTKKEQVYPDKGGYLTDGKAGDPLNLHDGWVGYMRAEGRHITLDLKESKPFSKVSARFLHNPSLGILMPKEVEFSASLDGENYYRLGNKKASKPLYTQGPEVEVYTIEVIPTEARYVRVSFLVDVWTFIDEITVWGSEVVSTELSTREIIGDSFGADTAAKVDLLQTPQARSSAAGGMNHMVLIYSGDKFNWQKMDFLPYVGYLNNETFVLEDYLFDGFLFLPYGTTQDGYSFGHAGKPSNKEKWQNYLDSLFLEGQNLAALNDAVSVLKKSLADSDYKAKVEIAIPYPSSKQTNFGELDGEQLSFSLRDQEKALKNRWKAVSWYVKEVVERFDQNNYENLELVAFYWFEENISHSTTPYETELVRGVSQIVHENNLVFHWIPFVQAENFRSWNEVGFDLAMMQPNYFFHPDAKEERLENNALLAKKYGLSVEIEVANRVFTSEDYRNRFKAYLRNALEYGFNKSLLGYYQETMLFGNAAMSNDPEKREIYEWVYQFIRNEKAPE